MIADLSEAYRSPYLAVDTETNAKDARWDPEFLMLGISIAFRNELGVMCSEYYTFNHWDENDSLEIRNQVIRLIENHPCLIFHNAKFDLVVLHRAGIQPRGRYYDTMLMAHWVNENLFSKELDWLGKRFLGKGKLYSPEFEAVKNAWGWGMIPGPFMKQYAANDAELTFDLFHKFYPKFKAEGYDGPLWERECRFIDLVIRMEQHGILIDQDFCKEQIAVGEKEMRNILLRVGFNPSSNPQLGEYLINSMDLPIVKTTKTGCRLDHDHVYACKPSFDKYAMEEYEAILEQRHDTTAVDIRAYRGWQKTVSSNYQAYLELLGSDGKLRPNLLLHGTRTGRLSCRKPNLQQIPKSGKWPWNGELKRAFLADDGYGLYGFDYANLELRLAAIYSKDDALLDAFNSGVKIFDVMAAELGWPRDKVKTFTYAVLYGGGNRRISNIFGVSYEEARALRAQFFNAYRRLQDVIRYSTSLAGRRGYVSLWTERRRHFGYDSDRELHKVFNSIIQGGAAEIVKSTMLEVDSAIDWDECKMLLQVHDEEMFAIAKGEEDKWSNLITAIMSDVKSIEPRFGTIPFPVERKVWNA